MPKNIISIRAQKKLLQDAVFNSTASRQMRVIIDIGDTGYYLRRAVEFTTLAKDRKGKLREHYLINAQMLINIARYKDAEVCPKG